MEPSVTDARVNPGHHPRRPNKQKATDEQLRAAYRETRSVWAVGERFGMCGQSAHERLVKMGEKLRLHKFTEEQDAELRLRYEFHANQGTLSVLARFVGVDKTSLARRASQLGLTNPARKRPYHVGKAGPRMRAWHQKNEHPRGMLGKTHTDEFKQAQSDKSLTRWLSMSVEERSAHAETSLTGHKAGWREIGGKRRYFRSRWEANYAYYLQWLKERGEIIEWEHEPETFWFEAIKRGCRSYLPDFRVTERGGDIRYHEVKGYLDAKSQTKLKRMKIYHPTVVLILVDGRAYRSISRISQLIPGWER